MWSVVDRQVPIVNLIIMNETLTNFRQAVAGITDLQEKVRGGADLVAKISLQSYVHHYLLDLNNFQKASNKGSMPHLCC